MSLPLITILKSEDPRFGLLFSASDSFEPHCIALGTYIPGILLQFC